MTVTTARQITARDAVQAAYGFGSTTSDAATGANAALWAAHETLADARTAWDALREAGVDMAPIDEVAPLVAAARRNANLVRKAADRLYGVVSSVAAGLWVVMDDGRVGIVEDTTHGEAYLDGVRFADGSRYITRDVDLEHVVALVEFQQQAEQVAEHLGL